MTLMVDCGGGKKGTSLGGLDRVVPFRWSDKQIQYAFQV